MEITIAELVRNGTMSAEMAATLWAAVDERRSFLTVAIPRFAGKSTTSEAILALRAADIALHRVDGSEEQMERLKRARLGGYLVVGEFSQAPVPGYIWGEPVQRVFETLAAGYSLQAALHAAGVEEAIRVVTEGNGVSDELASAFDLVLYIERFGEPPSGEERPDENDASYWRRLVHLYELDHVENGAPQGRTLFRWLEDNDQFEAVETPRSFSSERLEERTAVIAELASSGHTGEADVAETVAAFRSG